MARSSKSSSSNIYSQHSTRHAEDLADRSLRNEFVNPADAHGIVPSTLRTIAPDVEVKHLHSGTGSGDRSRSHKGEITGGSDKVTNDRQRHENTPVEFREAGAGGFPRAARDQQGRRVSESP